MISYCNIMNLHQSVSKVGQKPGAGAPFCLGTKDPFVGGTALDVDPVG